MLDINNNFLKKQQTVAEGLLEYGKSLTNKEGDAAPVTKKSGGKPKRTSELRRVN